MNQFLLMQEVARNRAAQVKKGDISGADIAVARPEDPAAGHACEQGQ